MLFIVPRNKEARKKTVCHVVANKKSGKLDLTSSWREMEGDGGRREMEGENIKTF
jgi:hypothetical protein